ncbi:hypothetical protein E2F48_08155 [Arthrobacter crusticola]|uniref:DUF308 domain-containing protein n=1 Tax=Arthrobacter crusticola TaxID=2547960 RepID=A0A4R5TVT9_9MICC|nr:hypothetical protein [Arthrobacter crusticola]TDK25245.1 hypothetical protein E2F48_08155 [Arthrobacter crusticola]
MTATSRADGASAPPSRDGSSIWKPFLLRAAGAAVFGLLTIFWQDPSVHVLSIAGGAYLLVLGAGLAWTARSTRASGTRGTAAALAGGLLAAAGLADLVVHDEHLFAATAGVALAAAGAVELATGARLRRTRPAGNDLILVGAVSVLTAVALPFVVPLGAHALLGVAGGGALLTAVVLGIAALSYRQDAGRPGSGEAGAHPAGNAVN